MKYVASGCQLAKSQTSVATSVEIIKFPVMFVEVMFQIMASGLGTKRSFFVQENVIMNGGDKMKPWWLW